MTITLRPVEDDDMEFLYRVYASTREEELAQVDWDDEKKAAFLRMQFAAQHAYYTENYRHRQFQVILHDGQPAGRLFIDWRPDEIRIMDIALLPAHRRQGIGSYLLRSILDEGRRRGLPVTIHVESFNPAKRLYQRLGFRQIAESDVYQLMKWSPPAGPEGENTRC